MAEENLDFNIEQLPFSLEAEQSVLGAILIETGVYQPSSGAACSRKFLPSAAPAVVFHHAGNVYFGSAN